MGVIAFGFVRMMKKCVKIGEGVYGEVFKTDRNKEHVALKVSTGT